MAAGCACVDGDTAHGIYMHRREGDILPRTKKIIARAYFSHVKKAKFYASRIVNR
jgi:hypothetical protein